MNALICAAAIFQTLLYLAVLQISSTYAMNMYLEHGKKKSWDDAYDDCLKRGMELAVLNSQARHNMAKSFLWSTFPSKKYKDVWIGYKGKRVGSDMQFSWINGENNYYEGWEPNGIDHSGSEACARLKHDSNYRFGDHNCKSKYYFLCTEGTAPVVQEVGTSVNTVLLGSPISIHCSFESLWEATIKWIHMTSTQSHIVNILAAPNLYSEVTSPGSPSISTLRISSLEVGDFGVYKCRVTNQFGSVIGPNITVNMKGTVPTVYTTQSTIELSITPHVILYCTYNSLSVISNVFWEKTTTSGSGTVILDTSSNLNNYSGGSLNASNLTIESLWLDNEGYYRCFVENQFGLGHGDAISVKVKSALPIIENTGTAYEVQETDNVTLNCNVISYPGVTSVVWSRSNTVIQNHSTSMHLILTNVKKDDRGNYSCMATNNIGTTELICSINVVEKLCCCGCDYKARLDYWTIVQPTNYTFDELKIVLIPVTNKLRKDLLVNTSTLSASIYKRNCMNDDRLSSQRLGYLGIALLSFVGGAMICADLTSLLSRIGTS